MMLFRSEDDIDNWCLSSGEPRGDALPMRQVWELSKVWYGNRMSPDFRGRSAEQVAAVFVQAGLTSDFWRVS